MKINEVTQVNEIVGGMLGTLAQSFMKQMGDYQSASLMDPMSSGSGESQQKTQAMAPSIYRNWMVKRNKVMADAGVADWKSVPDAKKYQAIDDYLKEISKFFGTKVNNWRDAAQSNNIKDSQTQSRIKALVGETDKVISAEIMKQDEKTPTASAQKSWAEILQRLWQIQSIVGAARPGTAVGSTAGNPKDRVTIDAATKKPMIDGTTPLDFNDPAHLALLKSAYGIKTK
jgi:hypothetical protein